MSAVLALSGVGLAAVSLASASPSRTGTFASANDAYSQCQQVLPASDGLPPSCAHEDVPPAGVDVTKPVATATLEARRGGAAAAVKAAQEQGVPVAAAVAAVSNLVPCDGDGTSGFRTQAIYAVPAGKTNRYAALNDQIKQWASGVNTVFNLSATKTGGVRDVRFVSAVNGDGTCSPTVLNVTLPATAFASFGATITAMRNLGYTATNRKYLVWADATGQCGIAQTYLDSQASQSNYNNGYAAQFARIDTACWGQTASVEAHELSHTFGSVQRDAPHATKYGHCVDESDRMCYVDGAGSVMKKVCANDQEVLFDCRDDDYYSTYPSAGSYLATHWNTADSRFLIGGGDGTARGTAGSISHLGGSVALNNPAVPGLPTQVSVNLEVVSGRTATVAWTSTRTDCTFDDKTAAQTLLRCAATTSASAPVTATVTDSAGEKISRTGTVTFAKTARTAAAALSIDGEQTSTYTACTAGHALLTATVTDTASEAAVKGVTVTFLRKVGTAAPVSLGTAVTASTGVANLAAPIAPVAGVITVKTSAAVAFPAVASSGTTVTTATGVCATSLSAGADPTSVNAGGAVVLSGNLTRTPTGGSPEVAAGETVSVYGRASATAAWVLAGSAKTDRAGHYALTFKPVSTVIYQARFAAVKGLAAASASPVTVTVVPWTTTLTSTPSSTDPVINKAVTLAGTLAKSAGSVSGVMGLTGIQVIYPIAGHRSITTAVTTKADGSYAVSIKPTAAGTVTVRYLGKTGWTSSSATVTIRS